MYINEQKLVDDFLSIVQNYFSTKDNIKIKREMSVGGSKADIVILFYSDSQQIFKNIVLNSLESVIISILKQKKSTRIDLLEKKCRLSKRALRDGQLTRLEDIGIISFGKGGKVELSPNWSNNIRIIAIEAKLKNWKKAIIQAQFYKQYADESFVLLPRNKSILNKLNSFKEHGIGLLTLENNKLEILVQAVQNNNHDWRREFVYSRLLNT